MNEWRDAIHQSCLVLGENRSHVQLALRVVGMKSMKDQADVESVVQWNTHENCSPE
jgi:hypothetical protein